MSDAHTRLEPVDRWDEAAQRWVTAWVTVTCQTVTCQSVQEPEPRKAPLWNDSALTSMLGPVL